MAGTLGADGPVPTAFVLAGGLGTRLRGVVAAVPKVLAPVGGRPFLAHLLERLARGGVRHVVLCTGYRAAQVESAIGAEFAGMEISYSVEPEPLGTAGALRLAAAHARTETLLVLNGDSFLALDYAAFLDAHRVRGARASMAVVHLCRDARANV